MMRRALRVKGAASEVGGKDGMAHASSPSSLHATEMEMHMPEYHAYKFPALLAYELDAPHQSPLDKALEIIGTGGLSAPEELKYHMMCK